MCVSYFELLWELREQDTILLSTECAVHSLHQLLREVSRGVILVTRPNYIQDST